MAETPRVITDLPDGMVRGTADAGEDLVASRTREADQADARRTFLETAHKRFQTVAEVEATLRQRMVEDLEFLVPGNQWDASIKQDRYQDGRPCLEVDRLTQPIKQVTNQQRQMRPAIQVNPVDSGADPDTAEVLQGLVRHIEVTSDADTAYDTAGEHQAKMGRGYWRLVTEYVDDTSFNQEVKIKRVRNPFSVYLDPGHQEADGSDARYAFIVEDLPKEEYNARFGEGKAEASLTEYTSAGNEQVADWYPEGRIRIANYYSREDETVALVQDPEAGPVEVPLAVAQAPGFRLKFRRLVKHRVKVALINAMEILEGNDDLTGGRDWPGSYIPIAVVIGDETDINGVVDYQGVIRRAKDAQRMANYWKTSITETIALAPRAPYIGVEGQFEGHEVAWKLANRRNFPYLEYKPVSLGGQPAPPPQRQPYEPPIQAMSVALMQNENDLRAVTGYVDVQAAENRSEVSGRAILARQKQSELGNSNYLDNLGRAIRHTGRMLLDLIPRLYDVPRIVRILGTDNQPKAVMVMAGQGQGAPPPQVPPGVQGVFDVGVGRYDVTITVGPSHQSRRQEFVESALQLVQAQPAVFPIVGDLLVREMDWPNADKIADRLQKALPPQLQETPEGQPQIPPQLMAQMQQAQQLIDALTQQLNAVTQEMEGKKLELASRERIAQIQAETDLAIAQSRATSTEQIALLEAKMRQVEQLVQIDLARLQAMQTEQAGEADRAHQAQMAEAGRAHEADMAAQQQTAAVSSAEGT